MNLMILLVGLGNLIIFWGKEFGYIYSVMKHRYLQLIKLQNIGSKKLNSTRKNLTIQSLFLSSLSLFLPPTSPPVDKLKGIIRKHILKGPTHKLEPIEP